jgi:2-polyprenyl-3-methyl-5-hydroxy-6-metoxy-1,4-benzoquinol methylase
MLAARVPDGARVLDVGAGEGAFAEDLQRRGCKVVALEVDPGRAEAARARGLEVAVKDMETADLSDLGKFDVIVCADVLEHLTDPAAALARLKAALAPGGRILASIPNVAHYGVRLRLLAGRFEYTETGILDRTHLRFFTRASAKRLFEDAGFEVVHESITVAPPTSGSPALVRRWERVMERKRAGHAVHRAMSVLPGFFGSQIVIDARLRG